MQATLLHQLSSIRQITYFLKSSNIPFHSSSHPAIAVLIPHFNNPEGVKKTLHSLAYPGLIEIVVVDDGSDEAISKDFLGSACSGNVRLHLIELPVNLGVELALNKGLEFIKNNLDIKYIARIDVGDVAVNDRLEKQVLFLENNPPIGILGTAAKFVDFDGQEQFKIKYPLHNNKIKQHMGLRCSVLHPTVMFRGSIFSEVGFYPSKYPFADDYAFFYQLMHKTKAANLPEILTIVEHSSNSVSVENRTKQLMSRIKVISKNFFSSPYSLLGITYTSIMLLFPYSLIVSLKSKLR